MSRFSIIVLNWNGERWLPPCLDSVLAQTHPAHEILVVDNHSTDGSLPLLRGTYPGVTVVELDHNQGYAGANNAAARHATGEWLLFLNNDTKMDPGCLAALAAHLERRPEADILALTMKTYDGASVINQGIGCDPFGFPINSGKLFYADGAAYVIRRPLFERLGGFDESYFIFFEESDLTWRARVAGASVQLAPEAVVCHFMGGSVTSIYATSYTTNYFRRRLGERNNFRSVFKNYSWPVLLLILPVYVAMGLGEASVFFLAGKWRAVREVYLKAWWENLRSFPLLWKNRQTVQQSRRVSDFVILKDLTWTLAKLAHVRRLGLPKFSEK